MILPMFLPLVFIAFHDIVISHKSLMIFKFIFGILPIAAGFLTSLQNSLAMFFLSAKGVRETDEPAEAANIYGIEALGGATGALATGVFLVPVFGINGTAVFCSAMSVAVLILMLWSQK